MILTGKTELLGGKRPKFTLFTTNPTCTDLRSNPTLRAEMPALDRLGHGGTTNLSLEFSLNLYVTTSHLMMNTLLSLFKTPELKSRWKKCHLLRGPFVVGIANSMLCRSGTAGNTVLLFVELPLDVSLTVAPSKCSVKHHQSVRSAGWTADRYGE